MRLELQCGSGRARQGRSASDFLSDARRSQIEILFPCRRAASNQRGAQYRGYHLGAFHGCVLLAAPHPRHNRPLALILRFCTVPFGTFAVGEGR
jgi:hypothetical protein